MNLKLAEFIIEACNNADSFFQDEESMPEIYEDYPEKNMFSDKTTAIICGDTMAVMAAVMCEVVERLGYDDRTEDEAAGLQDMLEDIRHLQTDSTGCNSVVIY